MQALEGSGWALAHEASCLLSESLLLESRSEFEPLDYC